MGQSKRENAPMEWLDRSLLSGIRNVVVSIGAELLGGVKVGKKETRGCKPELE